MDKTVPLPQPLVEPVTDIGRIKVGSCGRFPAPAPADVADLGRIKVGSCGRHPAKRNA